MVLAPLYTRTCALSTCNIEFQTDNPRKTHCSSTHSTLDRMRRKRARDRMKGGGDGGGNGGGGGNPTLFDVSMPADGRGMQVVESRKPSRRAAQKASTAAA